MPDPTALKGDLNAGPADAPQGPSPLHATMALLLSFGVLGVIAYFTFDPGSFRQLVSRMNVWFLGIAVLTVVARIYLGGMRLRFVSNGKISAMGGVRGQLSWEFFSNVTPSAIGGAPLAAVYVSRNSDIRLGDSTAVMLFAMLLDQLWLAFCIPVLLGASTFFDVFPEKLGTVGTGALFTVFAGMLAWVVVFAYATLVRPDFLERIVNRIFRIRWLHRFQERARTEVVQLKRRANVLRAQPARFFIVGFLYTAVLWILRYLTLLFIVWCVVDDFDKILMLLRSAALLAGSLVMPTPGAAGGIEGLYALFIGPLIPESAIAPTLLTWRLMAYYIFVALGVYLTMHHVQRRKQDALEAQLPSENGAPQATPVETTPADQQ